MPGNQAQQPAVAYAGILALRIASAPFASEAAAVASHQDAPDANPILEPNKSTIWYANQRTARISWITNASGPAAIQPVDCDKPLTFKLRTRTGDAQDELPLVLNEVAYLADGSVVVSVPPDLIEGNGYRVIIEADGLANRFWSEPFTYKYGEPEP